MDSKKSRFFGRFSPKKNFVYPPYFEDIQNFSKCNECEEKPCINACEENILEIENSHPVIKFGINGCTFCNECANVCESNVLDVNFLVIVFFLSIMFEFYNRFLFKIVAQILNKIIILLSSVKKLLI